MLKNDGFMLKNGGFMLQNGGFMLKNGGFMLKNGGFMLKNDGFMLKNGGFMLKNDGFMLNACVDFFFSGAGTYLTPDWEVFPTCVNTSFRGCVRFHTGNNCKKSRFYANKMMNL